MSWAGLSLRGFMRMERWNPANYGCLFVSQTAAHCSKLRQCDGLCVCAVRRLHFQSHGLPRAVTSRKQISMVLPRELIEAIKQRSAEQGLSMTAYVAELVRRDLGRPSRPDPRTLEAQLQQLQARMDAWEQHHEAL